MSFTDLIKPHKLAAGDKVAIISPSWAGASVFPDRYAAGIKQMEEKNEKISEDLIWLFFIKNTLKISLKIFGYILFIFRKFHFSLSQINPTTR